MLVLISGGGELPLKAYERLKAKHYDVKIIALKGFASSYLCKIADYTVSISHYPRILALLQEWKTIYGTVELVHVGHFKRPKPSVLFGIQYSSTALSLMYHLAHSGDNRLIQELIALYTEHQFSVKGVHELVPELLAAVGSLTGYEPTEDDLSCITYGMKLLKTLAPFDIGQGAVLSGKRILGIEGPEGTDQLLKRVQNIMPVKRFLRVNTPQAIFVKRTKLGQEERIDLPAIGPKTVKLAAWAGCRGIAIEASRTLIIDQDRTIALANRKKMFIYGYTDSCGSHE